MHFGLAEIKGMILPSGYDDSQKTKKVIHFFEGLSDPFYAIDSEITKWCSLS
jgi:hypothetical protein